MVALHLVPQFDESCLELFGEQDGIADGSIEHKGGCDEVDGIVAVCCCGVDDLVEAAYGERVVAVVGAFCPAPDLASGLCCADGFHLLPVSIECADVHFDSIWLS